MTTRLWIWLSGFGLAMACGGEDAGDGGQVGFGGFTSSGNAAPVNTVGLGGEGSEPPCPCSSPVHCKSHVCSDAGFCEATRCFDGVLNGSETDIDCGGPGCAVCGRGEWCASDGDCASGFCVCGICLDADDPELDPDAGCEAAQGCADGIHNLEETDVDCGGPECEPCETGQSCFDDRDCESGSCGLLSGRPTTCGEVQACD